MIHPLIPDAALDQHKAVVGKTGSGKTFAAKGIVEARMRHRRQQCVIDPTGAWWGTRLSADGRSPGMELVIIGGEHGDIPLTANSGAAVARIVAEQGASVVVDTSLLLPVEYTRWFTDFAGTLFSLNRHSLDLTIDEAHQFMPQDRGGIDRDVSRMLHAGNRLMSGGRSRGIIATLITQRPAKLHKDSLTCADTLIAMRVIAPQDRAAIKAWVDGSGDAADGKRVLDSLASLQRGEGWVWYPEGGHLERCRFPAIATYDSSAAPKHGAKAAPKLGEIKLDEVRGALADAVKEAEANDPAKLKARVAELERQLRTQKAPPPDQSVVDKAVASAVAAREREWKRSLDLANVTIADFVGRLRKIGAITDVGADSIVVAGPIATEHPKSSTAPPRNYALGDAHTSRHRKSCRDMACNGCGASRPAPRSTTLTHATHAGLSGPQQRILDAIAWWQSLGVDAPSRSQVGFVASIRPSGGHFKNTIGPLLGGGLLVATGDLLGLTERGDAAATRPDAAPTLGAYHEMLRSMMQTGPQRRILDAVIEGGGAAVPLEEIGRACAISIDGGHFKNTTGPLKSLGLIVRDGDAFAPTDLLFPPSLGGGAR